MQLVGSTVSAATGPTNVLALRVRTYLCQIVGQATPITYQALANALDGTVRGKL